MSKKNGTIVNHDPPLSVSEVARIVRKSSHTVRRWLSEGLIKYERIGGMYCIRKSELQKFTGGSALNITFDED